MSVIVFFELLLNQFWHLKQQMELTKVHMNNEVLTKQGYTYTRLFIDPIIQ